MLAKFRVHGGQDSLFLDIESSTNAHKDGNLQMRKSNLLSFEGLTKRITKKRLNSSSFSNLVNCIDEDGFSDAHIGNKKRKIRIWLIIMS